MSQKRNYPNSNPNNGNQNRSSNSSYKRFRVYNELNGEVFIHPYSMYERDFPNFKEPIEIGNFISEKRKIDLESRQLYEKNKQGFKYLALPEDCSNCNFDLKLGLEKFVPHIPHQKGIDTLLEWIMENKSKLLLNPQPSPNHHQQQSTKLFKADFICWRGLLSALASTPYEKYKDWMFAVILYKGTYYMCEIETEAQKFERENMDEKGKQFTYWGHKFETYITSDLPNEKPSGEVKDAPDPENNFSSVVTTSLSGHNLLYSAEIDCCVNAVHDGMKNYCEIKTSQGDSIHDIYRFMHKNVKFLKWWIQSFLVNIQTLKVGLRTDTGIVKKIVDFNINEIAKPNEGKFWKESICFNFFKSILDFIKTFCVKEKELYIVYRAKQSNSVKFFRAEKNSELFKNNYFLRDWFLSAV